MAGIHWMKQQPADVCTSESIQFPAHHEVAVTLDKNAKAKAFCDKTGYLWRLAKNCLGDEDHYKLLVAENIQTFAEKKGIYSRSTFRNEFSVG